MKHIFLSYPVHPDIPVYGSTPKPALHKVMDMDHGDRCNTGFIEMSNHAGTHVDAPRHFAKSGRTIDSFSASELVFSNPLVADAPSGPGELIKADIFEKLLLAIRNADMILIRTGFHALRGEPVYCEANPGISEEAAVFIRSNFPALRAIGIDSISVSSFRHRDVGRRVHDILLREDGSFACPPLLLVEDMDFSRDLTGLRRVIIAPLALAGMDASPCTVFAGIDG